MALYHTTVLDNQIKALPTVDTASGAIATFNTDLTENLVEVKCQIVAKQASGTPSPVNPLPITTYTEMNVSHSGVNMWNGKFVDTTFTESNTFSSTYQFAGNHAMPIKSGQRYCAMIDGTQTSIRYVFLDKNQSAIGSFVNGDYTEVAPSNAYYLQWRTRTALTTGTEQCQIEMGTTSTAYEPYNGTTANIPFGQTVANGVIDITTGKLRVTWGAVVDMGSLNWSRYNPDDTNIPVFYANVSGLKPSTPNALCDIYSVLPYFQPLNSRTDKTLCVHPTISYIYVADTDYTSATDFTNSVNGHTFIYELATPIEIQLDSITLQALLNENNIWCDTGDTEVKYLLTVGKKIS